MDSEDRERLTAESVKAIGEGPVVRGPEKRLDIRTLSNRRLAELQLGQMQRLTAEVSGLKVLTLQTAQILQALMEALSSEEQGGVILTPGRRAGS